MISGSFLSLSYFSESVNEYWVLPGAWAPTFTALILSYLEIGKKVGELLEKLLVTNERTNMDINIKNINLTNLIKIAVLCLFLMNANISSGQNQIVIVTEDDLTTEFVKEGKNQFLVYREDANGKALDISIWERTVSFSKFKGKDVIVVKQNWKNQDSVKSRTIFSISNKDNFYPIYHYAMNGRGNEDAFDFTPNEIKGTDSVAQNSKKYFSLELNEPTYNWELDMETFQMLPFENSKIFRINFYHPGSRNKPAFYDYEVIGEEALDVGSTDKIDCWQLRIIYEGKNSAIFWVDKETQQVLKMVEEWDGIKRYKIKFSS